MALLPHPSGWQAVRQTATLAGLVVLGVGATLLCQRFLTSAPHLAQASPRVVQATEFDVVDQSGTVLAPGGGAAAQRQFDAL